MGGGVFRISMDIHCTTGMGVRPKLDGYGYGLGGIGIFYLFSGRNKLWTPYSDFVKYCYFKFF